MFVAIEGIEGAGKSTLRGHVVSQLSREGREIVVTREPGATEIGRQIRTLLLDSGNRTIDPLAELLLFSADRAQHLAEVVRPALARGALVLCDRYVHSTIAYQGYGRGLDLEQLRRLNEFTTGGLMPDLVLLLDLDAEAGLARAKNRAERAVAAAQTPVLPAAQSAPPESQLEDQSGWNRFEQQELEFHRRVRGGFLELAKSNAGSFVVLDAALEPEVLAQRAAAEICKRLGETPARPA